MQCNDVRQQMRQADNKGLNALSAEVQEHLTHCTGCQEYAADLQYRDLLQRLPEPAPRPEFASQSLETAWAAREGRRTASAFSPGWALATAAAVVLAVGVILQIPGPVTTTTETGSPAQQVVEVAPRSVREVDLLMVSPEDLPDARITLQMDDNVALQGYPDQERIRWNAAIAAGNNRLTLPVELRGEDSGSIVVEVESGGASKQMLLTVEPGTEAGQQVVMI